MTHDFISHMYDYYTWLSRAGEILLGTFVFFFFRQALYNISRHKFLATIPIPTYTIQNQAILPKRIHKTDDVEVKSLTITDLFV